MPKISWHNASTQGLETQLSTNPSWPITSHPINPSIPKLQTFKKSRPVEANFSSILLSSSACLSSWPSPLSRSDIGPSSINSWIPGTANSMIQKVHLAFLSGMTLRYSWSKFPLCLIYYKQTKGSGKHNRKRAKRSQAQDIGKKTAANASVVWNLERPHDIETTLTHNILPL